MALHIRNDEVDELARQLKDAINAPSKTEAVRIALQHELERVRKSIPLEERIKRLQDATKALGPDDRGLDMKKFMDEMWGGI